MKTRKRNRLKRLSHEPKPKLLSVSSSTFQGAWNLNYPRVTPGTYYGCISDELLIGADAMYTESKILDKLGNKEAERKVNLFFAA